MATMVAGQSVYDVVRVWGGLGSDIDRDENDLGLGLGLVKQGVNIVL